MKTCTICGVIKDDGGFEPLRRQCRSCRGVRHKKSRRAWYLRNREAAIQYTSDWRKKNPEYRKLVEYVSRKDTHTIKAREYRKRNPQKINALSRKYQCARIQRTPVWLTPDDFWLIEEAYDLALLRSKVTGILWEVDHIIPLRGKQVSGLHTPYNLQVIPKKANAAKCNCYVVT